MSNAPPAPPSPAWVFLVEDEAAVRRSLALLLQLHGYGTHEFACAEDFLGARPSDRPACALVDVRLPGMSGLALQARLRQDEAAPPVLLMTGQGDAALARAALLQGAHDYLEKPIDERALLAAVAAALHADMERAQDRQERDSLLARLALLTQQERVLFEQLTSGRQFVEIAAQLSLPLAQIEEQRAHVMNKLQAQRAGELFRLRLRLDELRGRALAPSAAPPAARPAAAPD